jgi:DNA-binding MarR family transcriptional regulator
MKIPTPTPLIACLERATHVVALWIERAFSDLRLTQAEAHVLAFLADHAPCSINDLHHSFGHKRSTLSSLLDRLEERGWIRRARHPTSRRLVIVELTDIGRSIAERVGAAVHEVEARLSAKLGAERLAEIEAAIAALEEELR